MKCSDMQPIKTIGIRGKKYYINKKYWGEIIETTNDYFKVKCNNGNKHMDGLIIKVNFRINQKT